MHHYQRAAARRTKNHSATPFSNCCCVRFSLASWTVFTFRTARVTPDSSPISSRWLIHRRLTVVRCRNHQASTCFSSRFLGARAFRAQSQRCLPLRQHPRRLPLPMRPLGRPAIRRGQPLAHRPLHPLEQPALEFVAPQIPASAYPLPLLVQFPSPLLAPQFQDSPFQIRLIPLVKGSGREYEYSVTSLK